MAGKPSNEKERSRALLSADARPKIEIPRASQHERREFKLPEHLTTPVPSAGPRADDEADEAASEAAEAGAEDRLPRRRRPSTAKFRDRTLGWFKIGDDLATQDEMPRSDADGDDVSTPSSWMLAAAGIAVVAVIAVALWLL